MENTIDNADTFLRQQENYVPPAVFEMVKKRLVAYCSACSAPSSIGDETFDKYLSAERDLFCIAIMGNEWNQPVRTAAESFLIAFDQLRSRLSERKIVLPQYMAMRNIESTAWNSCIDELKRLNGIN